MGRRVGTRLAALSRVSRPLFPHLRALAVPLLTLGVLPALHLGQALWLLAITLVPAAWLIDASAAFAQAESRRQMPRTGDTGRSRGRLRSSHGRWYSRRGRPSGSGKPLGHLLFGRPGGGLPFSFSMRCRPVANNLPPFATLSEAADSNRKETEKDTFERFLVAREGNGGQEEGRTRKKNRKDTQEGRHSAAR